MIGFSRSLSYEHGEDDVTVNTICPGAVEGDRIERMIERQAEERGLPFEETMAERITDRFPPDSIVAPKDVGELIVDLTSDHARNFTAQDINLDSGARQD